MSDSKLNLTTVIAIAVFLCLLAFLLLPVPWWDHPKPKSTACLSNIRQQCLSQYMYETDYDERLPGCEAWMDLCAPYEKNQGIYRCPEILRSKANGYGYAMHLKMSNVSVDTLSNPDREVLIIESIILDRNASSSLVGFPNPSRHGKNAIGFVDGHVTMETSLAMYQ